MIIFSIFCKSKLSNSWTLDYWVKMHHCKPIHTVLSAHHMALQTEVCWHTGMGQRWSFLFWIYAQRRLKVVIWEKRGCEINSANFPLNPPVKELKAGNLTWVIEKHLGCFCFFQNGFIGHLTCPYCLITKSARMKSDLHFHPNRRFHFVLLESLPL